MYALNPGGNAGGLVGSIGGADGHITNSYASGSSDGFYAGGLVGVVSADAGVRNSYATGEVISKSAGGGLVGMVSTGGWVTDSYFDKETTGWTYSPGGTGKTTSEMQSGTPFSNWDTSIWHFEAGKYPALYYRNEQYGVTYDQNGGGGTAPVDINKYSGFDSVAAAAPDGLTPPEGKAFKAWNTMLDGSGIAYAPGQTIGMPPLNLTLYAIWDTYYTVSYDLNTGTANAPEDGPYLAGDSNTAATGTDVTTPEG